MSLEIHNVWKGYRHRGGDQWVLRDVELSVRPGEFVSLIGHSGCGKSTLLNVIGGLTGADGGTVTLDGKRVTQPGPDRAMVFQHYSLLPWLSLVDNVRVAVGESRPAWTKEKCSDASERYLRAVGLWDERDKRPRQVSGGMQQRAAVARAFAVEPRAMLLDEPFGALDALTRAKLQTQLIELWQSESDTEIVVMVTHGIDEAILLSDRIVVMAPKSMAQSMAPSVLDIIEVDLPRPRDRVSVIDDPHYRQIQERLLRLLTNASLDAA